MALIDPVFAKEQLLRMGDVRYQHLNGQYPAYEWDFGDVNPPVLGWGALRVYKIEQEKTGKGDIEFLQKIFDRELLSFGFWVNRKDANGHDLFGGGFLGMDNIGSFDRDQPLPNGEQLEQSDGTSWMALFCITMVRIANELARHDLPYQHMSIRFFEHFLYIAHAMSNIGGEGIDLWNEEDKFFYDVLHLSSGKNIAIQLRSMVGLIPLSAVHVIASAMVGGLRRFIDRAQLLLEQRPSLLKNVAPIGILGRNESVLLSIVNTDRLKAVLHRMLDRDEFLSDYGIRALSRYHLRHPCVLSAGGQTVTVKYLPGESDSRSFGGNSNWRGADLVSSELSVSERAA